MNGFSKDVKCVFGFTNNFFRVALDYLNRIPMEGLGLKPLRILFGYYKDVHMCHTMCRREIHVGTLAR